MKWRHFATAVLAFVSAATAAPPTSAAEAGTHYYANAIRLSSNDFTLSGSAWTPGGGVRATPGPAGPASITWSIMAAGLGDVSGFDPHGGALTTDLSSLYAGGVDEITTIGLALDVWAAVAGITNLGQVADGGGGFGAAGAAGGAGHIRIGAVFIDGASGPNVLAHAFNPCNEIACGAGGNIGGDVHFDNGNTWSDCVTFACGSGQIDFFTVALHELGHSLGLGHTVEAGSIMEAVYAGTRRSLSADDIAGIQALYGVSLTAVPEPDAAVLALAGVLAVFVMRRKRTVRAKA